MGVAPAGVRLHGRPGARSRARDVWRSVPTLFAVAGFNGSCASTDARVSDDTATGLTEVKKQAAEFKPVKRK